MTMERDGASSIRVIVNADDFGYFDGVCQGIIDAAAAGRLTATGIMANGPALERWIGRLLELPQVSPGVHLNATLGRPLTEEMCVAMSANGGEFPGKGALLQSILLGRLPADTLLREWRAQIRRCLDLGARPAFLNSHEHIHVLPALYPRVRKLADEFGIRHVRAPRPEWGPSWSVAGAVRSGSFAITRVLGAQVTRSEPVLIGTSPSGRMDVNYLRWRFARLKSGNTYELMCHPGRNDDLALKEPKLAAYHDWEGELETLESPAFSDLLVEHQIVLVPYEVSR